MLYEKVTVVYRLFRQPYNQAIEYVNNALIYKDVEDFNGNCK